MNVTTNEVSLFLSWSITYFAPAFGLLTKLQYCKRILLLNQTNSVSAAHKYTHHQPSPPIKDQVAE